ncbi:hypothetical protein ACSBR2_009094 [Camellia fascicularis]
MYIENERRNAPLYLAATLDSVKMSKCIAKVDCKLIGVRNNEEMTHLFLAALNGKKHAFLYLDGFCSQDDRYHYYRSNNGKTVLHSAINGEFFDLAFQIICLYGDLVNYVQKKDCLHSMLWSPSPPPSKVEAALQGSTKSFTTVHLLMSLSMTRRERKRKRKRNPSFRRTIKLASTSLYCSEMPSVYLLGEARINQNKKIWNVNVVMRGLDAAGKTTIMYELHIGEVLSTVPTIVYVLIDVSLNKMKMLVFVVVASD